MCENSNIKGTGRHLERITNSTFGFAGNINILSLIIFWVQFLPPQLNIPDKQGRA